MLFKKEDDWLSFTKKTVTYAILLIVCFNLIDLYVNRNKIYKIGAGAGVVIYNKFTKKVELKIYEQKKEKPTVTFKKKG